MRLKYKLDRVFGNVQLRQVFSSKVCLNEANSFGQLFDKPKSIKTQLMHGVNLCAECCCQNHKILKTDS